VFKKIRRSVLPLKETDNAIIRLGKNAGFVAFIVLFICVSLAIIIGISLAL
jgi:hypothetical protein